MAAAKIAAVDFNKMTSLAFARPSARFYSDFQTE